jgi:hypothetical protein
MSCQDSVIVVYKERCLSVAVRRVEFICLTK